jgi:hypothetical protein
MIYIQHTGKKITGYSETQHFDNDLLIDPSLIDLSKISYYEVINSKLVYNASLLNEQLEKENKFFRLVELKKLLLDTDYKVIKCFEAKLSNEPMPYNYEELKLQRQAWRDEINELENE